MNVTINFFLFLGMLIAIVSLVLFFSNSIGKNKKLKLSIEEQSERTERDKGEIDLLKSILRKDYYAIGRIAHCDFLTVEYYKDELRLYFYNFLHSIKDLEPWPAISCMSEFICTITNTQPSKVESYLYDQLKIVAALGSDEDLSSIFVKLILVEIDLEHNDRRELKIVKGFFNESLLSKLVRRKNMDDLLIAFNKKIEMTISATSDVDDFEIIKASAVKVRRLLEKAR